MFSIANGLELEYGKLETFVIGIIDRWQLLSPTIVFHNEISKMCMNLQWSLCLTSDMRINETVEHLDTTFKNRKQDGIILVGDQGHRQLIRQLTKITPSIFSGNCPVFMPIDYTNDIRMRLDTNVIFYKESHGLYELIDKFAIKGESTITETLGYWNRKSGIIIQTSMSRWERRTDLKGAIFTNALFENRYWANFVRDKDGSIVASKGYLQEMLFYITDKLNLTIETKEAKRAPSFPLENGSWTGFIGLLERKEVDVLSMGLGINHQRSYVIDYPIATHRQPITLIAAIPKGGAPNMWVYVQVFGVYQWIMFIMLLTLIGAALSLLNICLLSKDEIGRTFGTKRGAKREYQLNSAYSSFTLVFFYVIQMGSHTNSGDLASRLLTLTASSLTFILFVYYTTDITAKMTSGASMIPIRTFDDVIYHNYKVITTSGYYERLLEGDKTGTAKNKVYHSYLKKIEQNNKTIDETWVEALKEVISDPKTLFYCEESCIIPTNPTKKALTDQVMTLKMDDASYGIVTLGLQKDSEFSQVFNYYILKEFETGYLKRIYRKYHTDLFTKENYEMMEPQPLGFNNVMFCFILMVLGISLAIIRATFELIMTKVTREQLWARRGTRTKKRREIQ